MKQFSQRLITLKLFVFVFLIVISTPSFSAKNPSNNKKWKQAESLLDDTKYYDAGKMYKEIFEVEPNNFNCAYKIGYCLLSSELEKEQDVESSIYYLKLASNNVNEKYKNSYSEKKAPVLSWYYLGVAYRLNGDYDEAVIAFKEYKKLQKKKEKKFLSSINVDREIQTCKDAQEEFDYRRMRLEPIQIEGVEAGNLRCPVLAEGANRLIFTNGKNNVFPPDINWRATTDVVKLDAVYMAVRDNVGGSFHSPQSIEADLQIKHPHVPVTVTADGSELYLIVDKNDNGNIFMSKFENGKYQPAQKVKKLNTRKWESHASITPDGSRIYFTSMRKGGYGGLDIWYSDRDDEGKWKKPVNMGENVNTKYHEEMPYIMNNGNALYFSSEGHTNIGGFDVFYSNYDSQSQSWNKAENLGYPFSTSGNDMGYIMENGEVFAFCPVNDNKRREGIGNCDCISLVHELVPELAEINGIIKLSPEDEEKLKQLQVRLVDSENKEELANTKVDEEGKFVFDNVERGKYDVVVYLNGEHKTTTQIEVPQDGKWDILIDEMIVTTDDQIADQESKEETKSVIYVENVFFDFDKYNVKSQYNSDLDKLANWLNENPEAELKISGHTDHYGTEEYNMGLSKRRAESVQKYLLNKGVKKSQLVITYHGESQPLTIDVDDDTIRHLNRVVLFEVIKQGNPVLMVKPVIVPEGFEVKRNIVML
ncbi:MAG TPA: OmpA family protein [Bacteroidales bacterium]|nr:OmpA family protein [Bacteroidales bacterium]HPL03694.1 OmpA family protein [Bacteroidales bacterium]